MTLPNSGNISLGEAATELQRTLPITLGDAGVRGLASKSGTGAIALSDIYGADQIEHTIVSGSSGSVSGFKSGNYGTFTPGTLLGTTIGSVTTDQKATPLPIPTNTVNLSTYGGLPNGGSTGPQVVTALQNALNALKAAGGGTLKIDAGTYAFGSVAVTGNLVTVNDLTNVLIDARGAVFTLNSGGFLPVFFRLVRPNNVTIWGLKMVDSGFVIANTAGAAIVHAHTDGPTCKNFRLFQCETDGALHMLRSDNEGAGMYKMENIEALECVVKNTYYGCALLQPGIGFKAHLTTENVRRAVIAHHLQNADIQISGYQPPNGLGSNGFVALLHNGDRDPSNININVSMTGVGNHYGIVHFYHQQTGGTGWYENIRAHVSVSNIVSDGVSSAINSRLFRFSHDPADGSGPYATTTRGWHNIRLTGSITGAYPGQIIQSETTSTVSGNSVYIGPGLSSVDYGSLPAYFTAGDASIFEALVNMPSHYRYELTVALNGTFTRDNGFRAVSVNGSVYDPTDAISFGASGGVSTWVWDNSTSLVSGAQSAVNFIVGPGTLNYATGTPTGVMPNGGGTNWTLTFEDDFTGSSLDASKWNTAIYYETPDSTVNYNVANGCLNIWPASTFVNRTIDTDGKFAQQYGFFEMRAKLPVGKGIIPAFWLYYHGNDADTPGIDVMKTWCGATTGSNGGANALTVHYYGDSTIWGGDGAGLNDGENQVATPMPATFDANIDARYTVTNSAAGAYGVSGMSMQRQWDGGWGGMTSWASRLANESLNAHILILNNCINDTYEGLGTANYKQRIRDLVGAARTAGKYVVLQTPNETDDSGVDAYRTAMLEVATELGVYVIDVYTYTRDYRITNSVSIYSLCPDGYHPNQAHYTRIGQYCATRFTEIMATDPSAPKLASGGGTIFANGSFHPINYQGAAYSNTAAALGTRLLSSTGQSPDLSSAFHTYGMRWDPDGTITWLFDGVAVGSTLATGGSLSHALYPLLSLWFGGASGTPDGTTPTGSSNAYQIDYVRVWSYGQGSNPTTPTSGDIEFYGNSTLTGYNGSGYNAVNPVQAFASVRTNYNVINEAVNSTQAAMLVAGSDGVHGTFASEMATSPAEYVVLGFGLLDQFDVTTTAFKSTYASMFTTARTYGKIPVVMTPFASQFSGTAAFAQAARDVAAANGVPVLDVFSFTENYIATHSGVLTNYLPDGIHPNQELSVAAGQYMASEWLTKVTGSAPPPTTGGIYPYGQGTSGFTLTFNEEFDGTSLDPAKWNDHIWYESSHSTINYRVQNGQLDIWPADPFVNRTIDTDGKFYQTYGFFEIEAKLPVGKGVWPAFWLYNHDVNDERLEIDILEAYPGDGPNGGWGTSDLHPVNVGFTCWSPVPGGTYELGAAFTLANLGSLRSPPMTIPDLSAAFHKYGVKWAPDGITFYFDGVAMTYIPSNTNAAMGRMTRRAYILLDLWFGSASGTPNTSETPQGPSNSFSIKYVRAWSMS